MSGEFVLIGQRHSRKSRCPLITNVVAAWVSGKPTFEVLARAAGKLAAVDALSLELKGPINANDQEHFEVALALDQYLVASLFGRNGLDLNALAVNRAVRPGRVGRMAAKTKLDLCVDFP